MSLRFAIEVPVVHVIHANVGDVPGLVAESDHIGSIHRVKQAVLDNRWPRGIDVSPTPSDCTPVQGQAASTGLEPEVPLTTAKLAESRPGKNWYALIGTPPVR